MPPANELAQEFGRLLADTLGLLTGIEFGNRTMKPAIIEALGTIATSNHLALLELQRTGVCPGPYKAEYPRNEEELASFQTKHREWCAATTAGWVVGTTRRLSMLLRDLDEARLDSTVCLTSGEEVPVREAVRRCLTFGSTSLRQAARIAAQAATTN